VCKMGIIRSLKCIACGIETEPLPSAYVCPACGANCEVAYENPKVTRHSFGGKGIGRYLSLLPIESRDSLPPLPVGDTPLHRRDDIARELGIGGVWFKDDGRLPSSSFKDRASALVLARAIEFGFTEICTASTGNAAAASACLGASAGFHPWIFVPRSAPKGKIAQLVTFGARLFLVDGNYDSACDISLEASKRFGWYNRSTGYNPYTREGKKTVSFEILEEMDWNLPDWVVVPVGDGNIISGTAKGFRDAMQFGLIDKLPKLLAAQSERSSAISDAVNGDGIIRPVKASTIADSISVDLPRDGVAAVKAIRESNGRALTVSDEAILEAQAFLARRAGIFAEPAAACGVAALLKAAKEGIIAPDEKAVVLITGNGLKDVEAVTRRLPELPIVEPEISSVEKAIKFYR